MTNEEVLEKMAQQLDDDVKGAALLYAHTKRKPMDRDAAEFLAFIAGVEWCATRFPTLVAQVEAAKISEPLPGDSSRD